jgi:putative ABC transport system permease protein
LTFAQLEEGASPEAFERQVASLAKAHLGEDTKSRYFSLPMTELYLSDLVSVEGFRGEQRYIYIFGVVALFILLLACVNYVNLSTARSAQRAKEVGVRRTVGAGRFQVARQFLGESVLLTLGAFVLALVLARAALPVFNHLTDKELSLFAGHAGFTLLLLGVALAVGLLAGAYPALYLSSFRPTDVLHGGQARGRRGARLRKGLVALQFAVAVVLIAATGVVYQQLRYTQTKDLGFAEEQVVSMNISEARGQYEAVKRAFTRHPAVQNVAASDGMPGSYHMRYGFVPDSTRPDDSMLAHIVEVDSDYFETLGIDLVAGRSFSPKRATDDTSAYVLSEATARELGWGTPVGRDMPFMRRGGTVIGVVEDFHFTSFRKEISPVIFMVNRDPDEPASYSTVAVRFQPGQTDAVLSHLEDTWTQFSEEPLDYTFLDQAFAEMYRTERRLGQVFTAFALVAVLIACLGLYGLAAFAAERRSKEIAIRKTFGASTRQIVALLSKQFLMLVGVGFVLGTPVAWYGMSRWLEDFAYRIDLSPWLFAAAGLVALVVAMGATCWQALRAARTNPAQTLKDE